MAGHMSDAEHVVLVNPRDEEIGYEEKLRVHRRPRLHRAFSIFVLNSNGELLMQQRAFDKYHSAMLWSNTCCGHPRPGEDVEAAARRRLREEFGFECPLVRGPKFIYRAQVGYNLFEHELDHLFIGYFDGEPWPNTLEIGAWSWVNVRALEHALKKSPHTFTAWLPYALRTVRPFLAPQALYGNRANS